MSTFLESDLVTKVLKFLSIERWATGHVIHELSGHKHYNQTYRFINRMEKEGLINVDTIRMEKEKRVVFITHHGFGMVADFDKLEHFKMMSVSRISMNSINHSIDLQLLHVRCINQGYTDFSKPDYSLREKGVHYPDALAIKDGQVYAFEVERTVKTLKRYQDILGHYAEAIKNENINIILYVSPSISIINRIKMILHKMETIMVNGQLFKKPDGLLKKIHFYDYNQFGI